jgi:hypothetical protein
MDTSVKKNLVLRGMGGLLLGLLLLALGPAIFAWRLRISASRLIVAASQIHSTADADRTIAAWPRKSRHYSESQSPDGNGRAYKIEVGNGLLSKIHMTPSSGLVLEVIKRSGELQLVVLGMYTDRSSVWVQEDFTTKGSSPLSVNTQRDASGKPTKALIMFTAGLPEAEKERAFALDPSCLATIGGCESADEILPTVSQFGSR